MFSFSIFLFFSAAFWTNCPISEVFQSVTIITKWLIPIFFKVFSSVKMHYYLYRKPKHARDRTVNIMNIWLQLNWCGGFYLRKSENWKKSFIDFEYLICTYACYEGIDSYLTIMRGRGILLSYLTFIKGKKKIQIM